MLEAAGIGKTYRGKTVLRDTAFALAPGECLGVAGHNGSGKSTLLSIVAQVTAPDAGSIKCDGKDVLGDRQFLRRQVGYVPQQNNLLPDLTVVETLRFWQKTYGMQDAPPFAPGTPGQLLGLEELAKKRVGRLSGGMQKRVSTALALMHRPRFIIMDEVLPAMDRHYRKVLYAWLNAARAGGASLLYCSHEASELKSFCDNIMVLREGKTVFYGPAANFSAEEQVLDELMNPDFL